MKVKTISYAKVFPLAAYVNEKIGVEIELDERDDETTAFIEAKRLVEKFHKDNNPQLTDGKGELLVQAMGGYNPLEQPLFTQPLKSVDRKAIERLEILIDDAKTIEELLSFGHEADNIGLKALWDKKYKELLP